MIERWTAEGLPVPATALHGQAVAPRPVPAEVDAGSERRVKPPRSRLAGRIGWLTAMVVVGGMLGGVIIFGMKFIDGPVSATKGTTLKQLQAPATVAEAPAMSRLGGKVVGLQYPGTFDQVGRAGGSVGNLEAYILSSHGSYSRQIAINVSPAPSNNLEDESGYVFRSRGNADYTQNKLTLKGEPAVEFVKTDNTERTLYWVHEGKLLSVSATSSNPGKDKLNEYMTQITPTIQWLK